MPRNIRTLIKGLPDSPVIKEDWDITPITSVITPDLIITETSNCTVSPQGLVVADVTGATDAGFISVVKTNITMQSLETDKTITVGFRVDDVPLVSAGIIGIIVAPATRTAAQIGAEVEAMFFNDGSLANNRIFHYVLSFGTTYQASTTYRIPNTLTPNGVVGNFVNVVQGLADLEIGSESGMLLARRSGTLYIGRFDTHSDGIQYDLNGHVAVANGSVLDDTMTVFFVTLCADIGDGLENIAYTPSLDLLPPGYDTTGTSLVTATPTLRTPDWVNFANPVRPSYTQTQQAVLPVNVRIGQFYRVLIDSLYTGPDPTPYGYPLKHNQTVLINSITGAGNITAYVDNESLITLTADIIAPITTQQVLMAESIADFSALLQQTNNDVNKALLNAPEIIAYVKADSELQNNQTVLNFSTMVSFDTFDAAYTYLIALPRFIKKRIVFEDRVAPYNLYYGAEGVMYHLMQNNIVLSSYSKFCRLQNPDYPTTNEVQLVADVTSLHLESYVGNWTPVTIPLIVSPFDQSDVTQVVPSAAAFLGRLFLGDDCTFSMSTSMCDLSTHSAYINVGDRSTIYLNINDNVDLGTVLPIVFEKGYGATVNVNNSGGGAYTPNMTLIYVKSKYEVLNDQFNNISPDKIHYEFRGIDPLSSQYPGTTIIRHVSQLGVPNFQGRLYLNQSRYVFAASLDLVNNVLYVPYGNSVTIQQAGDVSISSNGTTPLIVDGICIDLGVHFVMVPPYGTAPLIISNNSYRRYGGELTGNVLFIASAPQFGGGGVFHMTGVRHTLWPGFTEIISKSSVSGIADFQIKDLYLDAVLGNTPLFDFNINTLQPSYKYVIDGIHGIANYSAYGLVDITNGYGKSQADIAETIVIKNIHLKSYGLNDTRPLVTLAGAPYDIATDPVFDYDGRRVGFLLRGATGNAGSSNPATPSSIVLAGGTYNEFGFYRDVTSPQLLRYRSRKHPRRFIYRLRANVYRTVSTGNAIAGIGFAGVSGTGLVRNFETFALSAANVRVPIEFVIIAESLPFNHQVVLLGCLSDSGDNLYFENIEFSIQET